MSLLAVPLSRVTEELERRIKHLNDKGVGCRNEFFRKYTTRELVADIRQRAIDARDLMEAANQVQKTIDRCRDVATK